MRTFLYTERRDKCAVYAYIHMLNSAGFHHVFVFFFCLRIANASPPLAFLSFLNISLARLLLQTVRYDLDVLSNGA